jgi:hypothetical protein
MRGDRALEVLSVLLLALATVGSAWCAYQASQWNGEEASEARDSTDDRVEASRLFSLGIQKISYDAAIVAQYAEAYAAGNEQLMAFYRERLVRPDFLSVIESLEQGTFEGGNLLENQEYTQAQLGSYNDTIARAEAATERSQVAGENADDYVVLTLVLASALFFAGVTSSFRMRALRIALLTLSGLAVAGVAARLADLPIT